MQNLGIIQIVHYTMYATKISVLDKIYATIYTGLEIRNLNGAKYFRKSHLKRKEGREGGKERGGK